MKVIERCVSDKDDSEEWLLMSLEERQPTIDPVVRCKDCEYYTQEDRWCRRLGLCGAFNEDDFCSHGEKRR